MGDFIKKLFLIITLSFFIVSCGNAQQNPFGNNDTLQVNWSMQYIAPDGSLIDWERPVLWRVKVFANNVLIHTADSLANPVNYFQFNPTLEQDHKMVLHGLWDGFESPPSDTAYYTYVWILRRTPQKISETVIPRL